MLGFRALPSEHYQITRHLSQMDVSSRTASALGMRTGALLHPLPEIETKDNKEQPLLPRCIFAELPLFCHLRLHISALGHFPLKLLRKL